METTLRLLLMFSRTLDQACREGALSDALPMLLAATGSAAGALYLKSGDALILAAQSGAPACLRRLLPRLGDPELSWFVAARAAESGELEVDRELPRRCASEA